MILAEIRRVAQQYDGTVWTDAISDKRAGFEVVAPPGYRWRVTRSSAIRADWMINHPHWREDREEAIADAIAAIKDGLETDFVVASKTTASLPAQSAGYEHQSA